MRITLLEIEAAARVVHGVIAPTPQYCWPLLSGGNVERKLFAGVLGAA